MSENVIPSVGDRWVPNTGTVSWRIVLIKDGKVSLTGPGICRAYKYVPIKELLNNWVKVDEGT